MVVCMRQTGLFTACYSGHSALCIVGAVWLTAVHQAQSKNDAGAGPLPKHLT
jgi:hypothetical protein